MLISQLGDLRHTLANCPAILVQESAMKQVCVCRTKHRLHLVSRRCNEALREPCDVWQNLTLHAKQISKVAHLSRLC